MVFKSENPHSKKNGCCDHCAGYLLDPAYGFYVEGHMKEMLSRERKRTERSGKPFMLMLLNTEKIPHDIERETVIKKVADMLFSVKRQTDPVGWYRHGSVIGVIFTEVCETCIGSLESKVCNSLSEGLGREVFRKIEILTYVFPEKSGGQGLQCPSDLSLYPDLSDKDISSKLSRMAKRAIDIAGGIAGLIIFLPFFAVIPVLIKLSSKGPVLYRQDRVGLYGRRFTFLKFRTMYVGGDDRIHKEYIRNFIGRGSGPGRTGSGGENTVYKMKDDPRVTRVGGFLRKSSLDELPQFFNVIKGDMSLVGPRPPIPYELEDYDTWHMRRVQEMKPGITGLWQVKGRSATTFDEMVRMDLKYISEWSVWFDIKILLQTPRAVLSFKGAY